MAIIKTSIGILTINSPFNENIITIVNNRATRVIGEMLGINISVYHFSPFILTRTIYLTNLIKMEFLNK